MAFPGSVWALWQRGKSYGEESGVTITLDSRNSVALHGQTYTETPTVAASELFRCTWTNHITTAEPRRVIPDNCADFIVSDTGAAWLVGPATSVDVPEFPVGTIVRGLRIQPAAIRAVTSTDATELTDATVAMDDVLAARDARLLAEAIWDDAVTPPLLTSLFSAARTNPWIQRGVDALTDISPLAISDIAAELALSDRHFRRLVQQETGLAPKTIQRVSRLHRILDLVRSGHYRSISEMAVAAGYSDQAHLARDVRDLADMTPRELVIEHG